MRFQITLIDTFGSVYIRVISIVTKQKCTPIPSYPSPNAVKSIENIFRKTLSQSLFSQNSCFGFHIFSSNHIGEK